jgi:alanyl-tRNA synthetase
MLMDKKILMRQMQKDPKRYWHVKLFDEKGYIRRQCKHCGKFFWTQDKHQEVCNDASCRTYDFIGRSPMKKMDYFEVWEKTKKFFEKKGHKVLPTFPVVCRWFPLYFTIAGIVDFYRLNDSELTFEFPPGANPSIVNQMCLRYNDIPNVGVNGKSLSCFGMINQQSLYDAKKKIGYWKDKCIELDYEMLTKVFRIKPSEINWIEDVWAGPSAFGPCIEFHIRGLEIGNAVFTEFVGTPESHVEMQKKVIDMGMGWDRVTWLSGATPTSYDVVFGDAMKKLLRESKIDYDKEFFARYARFSGGLNVDEVADMKLARIWVANQMKTTVEQIEQKVTGLEALYAVADHTRNLAFAIADGGIPSNTGGGYNLRVVLRRSLAFIDKYRWQFGLMDVIDWHVGFLKKMFPHLKERRDDIEKIVKIEEQRYRQTKDRVGRIVETIKKQNQQQNQQLTEEDLVHYYDSEGITPEQFSEAGLQVEIPARFYSHVTERHVQGKSEQDKLTIDVNNFPKTELIYYKNPNIFTFRANLLKVFGGEWAILDKTAFYSTGGGQLHDTGTIDGVPVTDVQKIKGVVLHKLATPIDEGGEVECKVNKDRREKIMKHHTATHIMLTAARKVLGPHVWQSGSEKGEDKARLDIAHYDSLTSEQMKKLEEEANKITTKDLPVKISWLPRGKAEKKYGFKIYQGGVVPQETLRIISVGNIDHEACGGIHVASTGEVGNILMLRSKRIADGTVRLEYAAGHVAVNLLKEKEKMLKEAANKLKVKENDLPKAVTSLFEEWKKLRKEAKEKK